MAYKEVSRVEITEVIRQWQAGRGIREITRSTGLERILVEALEEEAMPGRAKRPGGAGAAITGWVKVCGEGWIKEGGY